MGASAAAAIAIVAASSYRPAAKAGRPPPRASRRPGGAGDGRSNRRGTLVDEGAAEHDHVEVVVELPEGLGMSDEEVAAGAQTSVQATQQRAGHVPGEVDGHVSAEIRSTASPARNGVGSAARL